MGRQSASGAHLCRRPSRQARYEPWVRDLACLKEKPQVIDLRFPFKRVMGIEPTYPAWKAGVLPLNYTRMLYSFTLLNRGDRIRTCDLLVPNQALYQAKPHPVLEAFCLLPDPQRKNNYITDFHTLSTLFSKKIYIFFEYFEHPVTMRLYDYEIL